MNETLSSSEVSWSNSWVMEEKIPDRNLQDTQEYRARKDSAHGVVITKRPKEDGSVTQWGAWMWGSPKTEDQAAEAWNLSQACCLQVTEPLI